MKVVEQNHGRLILVQDFEFILNVFQKFLLNTEQESLVAVFGFFMLLTQQLFHVVINNFDFFIVAFNTQINQLKI